MSLLPEVERALLDAVRRDQHLTPRGAFGAIRTGPRARSRDGIGRASRSANWLRVPATRIPMLLSAIVVVIVAGVALTALKHKPRAVSSQRPAAGHSATASREQLIRTLGVLRRPQAKDYLPGPIPPVLRVSPASAGIARPKLDRPLVRAIVIAPPGIEVGLFPTITAPSGIEGLMITIRDRGISFTSSGMVPATVADLRRRGEAAFAYAGPDVNRGAIVVPDGVSRVELGPFRLLHLRGPVGTPAIADATSVVHANVAAFQLDGVTNKTLHLRPAELAPFFYSGVTIPSRHLSTAVYAIPALAQMTWYDANDQVISRPTIQTYLYVGIQHSVPGPEPGNVKRIRRSCSRCRR
jgi:hypothetical protein